MIPLFDRPYLKIIPLLLVLAATSCTSFHPLPLNDRPDLVTSLDQVVESVPPGTLDLSDGVDMSEAAAIAASMNPDLRAVRMKRNVAQAEAYSAGLLPDPQLSATLDHPTSDAPGLLTGFSTGISFNLRSLLTRPAEQAAAGNNANAADMDILWKEWQVIQKARTLYVQKYFAAQKLRLLKEMTDLDRQHQQHSEKTLGTAGATLARATADLASLMDSEGQLRSEQRAALQTDYELNALLGLAPGVAIPIKPPGMPAESSDAELQDFLETVADHRPDLEALQAAYKGQEASLYAAVLRQFPSISIGFNTARDTTNIHSTGFGVTLDLPIFNGGRGDIAVQSATREQLHAEYQARLDQTHADIATLWRQAEMIRHQLKEIQAQMPKLEAMAAKVRQPYASGDFPPLTYITLESSLLAKKLEYIDLQQSLWTNRIGLDTLLAWPVEPSAKKPG